jgi:cytidyltransferase-like protein
MGQKTVYIPMSADIVHAGHMKIIQEGAAHGRVTVGLLTDEAIASKKRLPLMKYAEREAVITNIKGVSAVVAQDVADYRPNLRKFKPDYVIHGDDWRSEAKASVITTLAEWGGELIELPYTEGISSTAIQRKIRSTGVSPTDRMAKLSQLLAGKRIVRALEAHNGLSAIIVEQSEYVSPAGKHETFDAIWISSLTDSTAKGKPDIELVDLTSRLVTINEVLEVTTKPLIVDGDTGGQVEHFRHTVRTLERLGVSAIVIEDKTGLKHNSLQESNSNHVQESPDVFAAKIKAGIGTRLHDEFMIIARIESLIVGGGVADALTRAQSYLDAGADILQHTH